MWHTFSMPGCLVIQFSNDK